MANLPHFSVKYYTSDLNSDEIPETEYIEISNIGKPTYSPTSVTLNFFYDVRNENGETRRIPITGYYNLRFVTDALEGRIFKASNPYNFQDYISTERTSNFYVQKMTLVRIDYTDIYVTRHSVVCVSCKSVEVVGRSEVQEVQKCRSVDTVVVRDSVLVRDSVVQRERTIHDTVYITKEVYRDRLEARGERQKAVRTDTVVVTEYRDYVIEHPPERYVPAFYKWCTIALWAIGLLAIGRFAIGRLRL